MKPGIPWSVKGVEPELREVAKIAARKSGMTLGEWLNSAINEQADGVPEEIAEKPAKLSRSTLISTHPIERAATKLEDIAEQLSRLAARETAGSYGSPEQKLESSVAFAKILSKVESNEKQTVEAFSAVNDRLATLSRQFNRPQATKVEESPGYLALDKAVRNIVEHLEVSDRRTRENMKTLQDRMSEMAARVNTADSEQILRQAPAFNQLESRLTDLAKRMEQPQPTAEPQLADMFRRELASLESRIDTVRESSETLAQKAQTQAVQAAQSELRTIEKRILGLLNDAQQSLASQQMGPAEMQRFRQDIETLQTRIDQTSNSAANDKDVSALKVAVEQLSTRVAQGPDMRPLAELERRFAELDQRLQQSLQNPQAAPVSAALEHKLAEVDERMGRAEHQLSHLATIERAITQLYDTLEQNRKYADDVARDAAGKMAEQFMSQPQAAVSLEHSPEIQALQQGLQAVREASQTADRHNQETLEAVHETLEQIVTKLAELETAAIGQRLAQAVAPTMPEPSSLGSTSQLAQVELPSANELFSSEPKIENFMDQIAADTGNPFLKSAPEPEPESQLAAPEAAPEAPQINMQVDDFVAAARRAHQVANEQKNSLSSLVPKASALNKIRGIKAKGFSLPFITKRNVKSPLAGDAPGKILPEIKAANTNIAGGSSRRLMFLGILALSLAAFAASSILGRMRQEAPTPPPAVEQGMPQKESAAPKAEGSSQPAAITPEQPTPPAAAAPIPQPEPAPIVAPEAKAPVQNQQGDAGSVQEADPILTGAVTPVNAAAIPVATTLEAAVGPAKLRQAAQSGDSNAQFIVATHFLNGDTVQADLAKAAYWYGKAAASGLAPAQYRLATLYERGKGVDRNLKAALSWYEQSASLGNVKAMHNAAVLAAGNEAGGTDYARAFKWFSLAANHGLKDSQYNLAVLIERGLGTKADPTQALFWYMAAAAQSDVDAGKRVEVLTKAMSPTTVDAVKSRLKNWTPEHAPDSANTVAVNDAQWNPSAATAVNLNDQAKTLLDKLGYRVGVQDGKLDAKTGNAIKLFQIQQGMKVTGKVTPELIAAMQSKTG